MKLFLIGWGHMRPEMIDIAAELQKEHDILYWVRMEKVFAMDKARFPNTIFHDYDDALDGKSAPGVQGNTFPPLSKELILAFSRYEAEILTMMEKRYELWGVPQRKDFYYDLLRYWYGVLTTYKPDVILYPDVPHEVYNFVIYAIAKHLNIRTILFENILKYDQLMSFDDYKRGNETLAAAAQQGFPENFKVEDLRPATRAYYLEEYKEKNVAPKYVGGFKYEHTGLRKIIRHGKSMWPFIKDGSIFERATKYFFKLLKKNVVDEFNECVGVADFTKKYVYLALHYQPERTTSPQGDIYVDQLLVVKTVAAALPKDWVLYVKEHPVQWLPHGKNFTPYRYPGFYKAIAALDRVRLIPQDTNTFDLIKHAQAVATTTGIPGLEAVLRGIPTLLFGYAYYMHCPGVFRVASVDECRAAFEKIEGGHSFSRQAVLNYFGVLDRVSVMGYFDHYGAQMANFGAEENARNILGFLRNLLQSTSIPTH